MVSGTKTNKIQRIKENIHQQYSEQNKSLLLDLNFYIFKWQENYVANLNQKIKINLNSCNQSIPPSRQCRHLASSRLLLLLLLLLIIS
jgi:hypothetical protein